ncbi:MAG: hypothetical protein QXK88_10510 [Desulfurococcaceae archaeon]
MVLKLFTPGHGAFMDSLIMYGLVSSLPSDARCRVSSTAGFFEIDVENKTIQEVANAIAGNIHAYAESIVNHLIDNLKVVQKGSRGRLESYLDAHKQPEIIADNLKRFYTSPGHAQYEGRYRKGQHVWLPFYPHVGKYFTGEYRYSPVNYGVCPTCITLAALGFYKAAIPIRFTIRSTPPKTASHIVLLSFEGEVSSETLANMLVFIGSEVFSRLVDELRPMAENLSLTTLTYFLLANFTSPLIYMIHESKAIWTALSMTLEIVKGQVVQIRGYEEISIDRYLSSLVHLMQIDKKYNINSLEKLVTITKRLIRKGETAAIDSLYKFLNTRSYTDLYSSIRQIVKALEEGPGKSFCEELACLTQLA